MEVDNDCWRIAGNCARWASENKNLNVRNAFLSMAKGWAQLALDQGGNKDRAVSVADNDQTALALLGFRGNLTAQGLDASEANLVAYINAHSNTKPHLTRVVTASSAGSSEPAVISSE